MRGRRKTVKISEAEWSIMKVLWDNCENGEKEADGQPRGMTLGEIVGQLAESTNWCNTTIRTLIIRLSEKGAVEIDKTTGVYKYTPSTSKSDCVRYEVNSFVDRVFAGSSYNLMASLVKEGKFTEKERRDIIRILNDIEEN